MDGVRDIDCRSVLSKSGVWVGAMVVDVDEMNDNEDGEGKTKEQESGVVDANENKEGQDGENKEA